MDEGMIGDVVAARGRRVPGQATVEAFDLDLETGRVLRIEAGRPPQDGEHVVVTGRCGDDPFVACLPVAVLRSVPHHMMHAEVLLMALVERAQAEILAIEELCGRTVVFEALDLSAYIPDPADLRIVPGDGAPDFALRLAPPFRAWLETVLEDRIERPQVEPEGVFGCTVVLGMLAAGDGDGDARPGTVLMIDRPAPPPFVMVEDVTTVTLDAEAEAGDFTVGSVGTTRDFLAERGVGIDDILLVADRPKLTADQLRDLEPGALWPGRIVPETVTLYRRGRAVGRARMIEAEHGFGLDILDDGPSRSG